MQITAETTAAATLPAKSLDSKRLPHHDNYIREGIDYVRALARSYSGRGPDFDELVSAGNVGLVEAALRFDPRRKVKFITYADWWIRKSLREAMASHGPVRLPRYQRDKLTTLRASRSRLTHDAGSEPDRDELARAAGFSRPEVEHLLQLLQGSVSLEHRPTGDDDGRTLGDTLADRRGRCAHCEVVHRDAVRSLRMQLARLSDRERSVLSLRFGLDGEPRTLREAGRELGLGRESVRQVEIRALTKLRRRLVS